MENMKFDKSQSRRDFFKTAAKVSLPFIAFFGLGLSLTNCKKPDNTICDSCASDCTGSSTSSGCSSCTAQCASNCSGTSTGGGCSGCSSSCSGSCSGSCLGGCSSSCTGSCKGTCTAQCTFGFQ